MLSTFLLAGLDMIRVKVDDETERKSSSLRLLPPPLPLTLAYMPPTLLLLKSPSAPSPPSSASFKVTHLPLLSTSFNLSSLSSLLSQGQTPEEEWDGIVLCSQRAVKAWEQQAEEARRKWKGLPHFVVGRQTRQALLQLYLREEGGKDGTAEGLVVLGEESGNGQELAKEITRYYDSRPSEPTTRRRRRRILFLSGDKGTEALPRALKEEQHEGKGEGIELVKIQVYATDLVEGFEGEFIRYIARTSREGDGRIWIGICSPSGGEQVVEILRAHHSILPLETDSTRVPNSTNSFEAPEQKEYFDDLRRRIRFVAIGNTTKDYLEKEAKVRMDATARIPGEQGMVDAVMEAEDKEEDEEL
ncbi:uroporphyrinogen-III synthase [Sporobolomyces salmoneus]|uniref:uroporphyrinogen-III synthase n=1 Tax=Sporobolomyces salmoneus TaxID=183962 RepID=UPI00317F1B34